MVRFSDSEMSKSEMRTRVIVASVTILVGVVVLLIKFWAYNITQSKSIYSDALESIVNVITALVGVVVVYYASKPADEDHPYGHGKVEYFSSAFEGGMISFAAIFVFIEAVKATLSEQPVMAYERGMFLVGVAAAINFGYGLVLKKVGKTYASPTLQAAGIHLMIDFWTTLGAIIGVFLVKMTGLVWIDRVVAGLLGVYMAFSGVRLVRHSVVGLLDAEDLKILKRLAEIFEQFAGDGVIQIHHTKVIRAGWFHHIDAHMVVPEFWTIDEAHQRLHKFEANVIRTYEYGGEANFHLDPCKRRYCSVCDYQNCPVRQAPFERRMPVDIKQLRSKTEPLEDA